MINDSQRKTIREHLILHGLTFSPLQEEMLDHICCDIEERVAAGASFDAALLSAMSEIPDNHFRIIQKQTMDTINKRFILSRWFSFAALAFLIGSVIFKTLHLQFGGELLLFAFVLMAAALLTSSVSGIYLNRDKDGALRVLAIIAGVVILLVGYGFRILNLSGADPIILLAVTVLVFSLILNTLFVYRNPEGKEDLLTFLHEKYSPGIERFLLLLLLPLAVYKVITIMTGNNEPFVGDLILLVIVFGAGLQFIALCWRSLETYTSQEIPQLRAGLIISSTCLVLVYLGQLVPFEMRVVMIVIYSAVTGWLAFKTDQNQSIPSMILVCFVPLIFSGWALIKTGILPTTASAAFFNIPVLMLLGVGLFHCKGNSTMRAFMIVSLSSYLFEYSR